MVSPSQLVSPSQRRALAGIQAELARLIRHDDESVVDATWIRQRYDIGAHRSFALARRAAVRTAWHEAGHAVAALATGARFSSISIRHGAGSAGRVHGIRIETESSFVIDAAGQIAERLMTWAMLERDDELAAWLATWRRDGDARRFRRGIVARFAGAGPTRGGTVRPGGYQRALDGPEPPDEVGAWRYSESVLVPLRPKIRDLARALLIHARPLPYGVAAAIVGLPSDCAVSTPASTAGAPGGRPPGPAQRRAMAR
jgi:hypothetical protein